MFRDMRRKMQQLTHEEMTEVLRSCHTGILGVVGDDGYPYTVPLNFVLHDDKLFFHCAREGHKTDAIMQNNKVSFCVVDKDRVVPQALATNYRSVIVFGRARILTDDSERRAALDAILQKYAPDHPKEGQAEIERELHLVCVVAIDIEHMTGKAALKSVQDMDADN